MSRSRSHSIGSSLPYALVATLLFGVAHAGRAQPTAALHQARTESATMVDTGLVVGNVLFGPSDAILRYTGAGRFIDAIVPLGTQGLGIPCCVTFGPDDNLYVSDPFGSRVLRFDGLTGVFIDEFVSTGSGGLVIPLILVFHGGHLYVGDPGAHAIRRYDAATGAFVDTPVQDNPAAPLMGGFDPQHFAFGPDGNLYVAAEGTNRILRYAGDTGAFLDQFVPDSAGFLTPSGLIFGADGRLYAGSSALSEVRWFDIATGESDVFVPAGSGGLTTPVGIAFGPDGNLYATSLGTAAILGFDGRTGASLGALVPSGLGGLSGPRTLSFNSTVTICHAPPARPSRRRTLGVSYMAGVAHAAHGDSLGACH